jgi:carbon storage regulator
MLVLSRKTGESIVVGSDVHVQVINVTGNRVKLGIEAPRSLRVLRSELVEEDDPAGCEAGGISDVETDRKACRQRQSASMAR